jgi:ATP-dependent DNA helicase RecG
MNLAPLLPYLQSVNRLKGVGEAAAVHLARLLGTAPEIPCLRDLLLHLPTGLLTRQLAPSLAEATLAQPVLLKLRVVSHAIPPAAARRGGRKPPSRVTCTDAAGEILTLVFFHAKPGQLEQQLPLGSERLVGGLLENSAQGMQMVHPELVAPVDRLSELQAPEPLYPLTAGLSNRQLLRHIRASLSMVPSLPEWQNGPLLAQRGWPSMLEAIRQLHHPAASADMLLSAPARQRLAYDELLASQLALALIRARSKRLATKPIAAKGELLAKLRTLLPYQPTHGQEQVLREIQADLASGERMQRLLQGDVGSGKTLVALMAALNVVEAGGQVAIMAPTEILARQHLAGLREWLAALGVQPVLLAGSLKGAERKRALAQIASGEARIIFGTHALFQESVQFANLQLAIIDEQHRFGVAQRLALAEKATVPHLLLMTATPIPRSLTMTAFGDMDSSILAEKPPGRQPIQTRAVPQSRREEVLQALSRAMAEGNKVYWICPLVEPQEDEQLAKLDLADAETRFTEFVTRFGAGNVALLHGRMKQPERETAMGAFAQGDAKLLVATTVVEVGVNVPSATIIVIEQAERFGLAQLHQLRGRVGRGSAASSCLLLYADKISEYAKSRLRVMRETEDGFRIAEEDLRLRGPGEILGTRQSGLPEFTLANLQEHAELISIARDDVKLILAQDEALASERGQALRLLLRFFKQEAYARFVAGG